MARTPAIYDIKKTAQVYYPSLAALVEIRFDEALVVNPDTPDPLSTDAAAQSTTPTTSPATEPLVFRESADGLTHTLAMVPKSASVELSGYRQAGKFSLLYEYRDFPFDPRTIRAASVAIHLDAVPADDFADGMLERAIPFKGTNPPRKSILAVSRDNLVLAGVVDDITVDHTDKGSEVRMEGRDLRGVLLDIPTTPTMLSKLNLSKNVAEVVKQIISAHPLLADAKIPVIPADPTSWPDGYIPSPKDKDGLTRVSLDAAGQKPTTSTAGGADTMSFWDIIIQYCFLVGAIPFFVGKELHIQPTRNLYDYRMQENPNNREARFPTPFKNGKDREVGQPFLSNPLKFAFRRIVFGRDILNLKIERKLGGKKVPAVKCVSWDSSSKQRGAGKLLDVTYPAQASDTDTEKVNAAKVTSVSSSGQSAHQDVTVIKVPNVRSKKQLLQIAKSIYEEVGRQEMGGSISTRNLASFGGGNQDPDLVRMKPGDAINIGTVPMDPEGYPPTVHALTAREGRSFQEDVKELTTRLGNANLARVAAATGRGAVTGLQSTFRVSNVKFTWGAESGVAIDFDFQNYVEARYDVQKDATQGPPKALVLNPIHIDIPRGIPTPNFPPTDLGICTGEETVTATLGQIHFGKGRG